VIYITVGFLLQIRCTPQGKSFGPPVSLIHVRDYSELNYFGAGTQATANRVSERKAMPDASCAQ
jgi:hypothetical protein